MALQLALLQHKKVFIKNLNGLAKNKVPYAISELQSRRKTTKTPPFHHPLQPNPHTCVRALKSTSNDALYHLLERRNGEEDWLIPDTLQTTPALHTFRDSTGEAGIAYVYRVRAIDDAGLTSWSEPAEMARTDTGLRGMIGNFDVRVLSTSPIPAVSWTYPRSTDLEGFQLYRAEENGQLMAYRLIDASTPDLRLLGTTFTYLDRDVTPGNRYTYKLLARHYDGGYSLFTPTLEVLLPR